MSTLARRELAKTLQGIVPRGWYVLGSSRSVDKLAKTIVKLQQTSIQRMPQAGGRVYGISFLCTITVPNEVTQSAEDRLDDQVLELVGALTTAHVMWEDCNKVRTTDDKQLGYDITLTIYAKN